MLFPAAGRPITRTISPSGRWGPTTLGGGFRSVRPAGTSRSRTLLSSSLNTIAADRAIDRTVSSRVDRQLFALSGVYFGIIAANVGLGFFLPQIVQAFGMSTFRTTLVSAVPYVAATLGIVLWGRRSDQQRERRLHIASPLVIASAAIAAASVLDQPVAKVAVLSVAAFGIFASMPVFWTLPTFYLSGAAAAGGIAMINSIGNLAGFAGPYVMGWTRDATGTYGAGLLSLSAACLMSTGIVLAMRDEESTGARRRAATV